MLNSEQLDLSKLERRARSAISGYAADVNITCYVYGADMLVMVKEVRELREKLKAVTAELKTCVTDNGRTGEARQVRYEALGALSVKQLCKTLGVGEG